MLLNDTNAALLLGALYILKEAAFRALTCNRVSSWIYTSTAIGLALASPLYLCEPHAKDYYSRHCSIRHKRNRPVQVAMGGLPGLPIHPYLLAHSCTHHALQPDRCLGFNDSPEPRTAYLLDFQKSADDRIVPASRTSSVLDDNTIIVPLDLLSYWTFEDDSTESTSNALTYYRLTSSSLAMSQVQRPLDKSTLLGYAQLLGHSPPIPTLVDTDEWLQLRQLDPSALSMKGPPFRRRTIGHTNAWGVSEAPIALTLPIFFFFFLLTYTGLRGWRDPLIYT